MRPARILIVEDEAIVAMDIESRLSVMGYEPLGPVSDGHAAFRMVEDFQPDLVLLDIELGHELDGIQVAQHLHELARVPIVFLTAYSEDNTLARAKIPNVFGYVLKPFEDRELKTTIEMAIYKHAAEQEIRRLTRLYATLSQVNQAIVRTSSRSQLLDDVCRLLVDFGGFKASWIAWMEPTAAKLVVASAAGAGRELFEPLVQSKPADCLELMPLCQDRSSIVNDYAADSRTLNFHEKAAEHGFRAVAALPLRVSDAARGVLIVYSAEKGVFTEKEESLVHEIAQDLSFALEKFEQEELRKRAEQTLRNSSQFYQQIIAGTWEGIMVCDSNLSCLVWNPSLEALTGIPATEAIGQHPGTVLPLLREVGVIDHMRAVLDGKMLPTLDFPFNLPKTGRNGWISHISAPLTDTSGNLVGVISMLRDISQYKKAEKQAEFSNQQLRQSEERYRRLVEFCPDAVLIHCDGIVEYVNPAGLKLFGADSPDQIVGLPMLELIHPDCRDMVRERIRLLREEGHGQVPTTEQKFLRLDCSSVDVDVSGTAFALGKRHAVLVMAHDITSRKMMEARFLRDQRIETIGALASGIAHDLNNVLSPITMTVALLRDKCEDPDTLALISTMEVSAHRGAGIIQQLLTFGRGATGQHTPINPRHLLKELRDLSGETFPKSIEVRAEYRNTDWLVSGNATHLHQVLLNLCVNARDAMPQGGRLTLFLDKEDLTPALARKNPGMKNGPYVVLGVQDTGRGIPESIRAKIFEPFFTTKEVGKGTGLGLATCLNLVKKHSGFIEWESTEGKGTLFKVYLPAVSPQSTLDTPSAQPNNVQQGGGETVLVVDDEDSIRRIVTRALERNGYKVLVARDGAEAVQVFKSNHEKINAVLIDVMMPVMGGPAAMRQMREIDPKVLLIATSGMIPRELERDLAESNPRRFIPKPFTTSQLLETISSALAEKGQS